MTDTQLYLAGCLGVLFAWLFGPLAALALLTGATLIRWGTRREDGP